MSSRVMTGARSDIKRLGLGDRIVGLASVALMIGILLPWFEFGSTATGTFSFSVAVVRTWMYVPFFVSLAVAGSIAVRARHHRTRRSLALWLLLVGACSADLVLTLAFVVKRSPGLRWDVGAYLSVAAAAAALIGAVLSRVEEVAAAR